MRIFLVSNCCFGKHWDQTTKHRLRVKNFIVTIHFFCCIIIQGMYITRSVLCVRVELEGIYNAISNKVDYEDILLHI